MPAGATVGLRSGSRGVIFRAVALLLGGTPATGGGMILRRYGTTVQSVEPNFDSRAMTEIGFQRTPARSLPTEEFLDAYEKVDERALTANAEGDVKDDAERALLASLKQQLEALEAEVGPDRVLVVESMPGTDYPKTRDRTETRVVGYENRLYFFWTVEPPLRLGVYRKR